MSQVLSEVNLNSGFCVMKEGKKTLVKTRYLHNNNNDTNTQTRQHRSRIDLRQNMSPPNAIITISNNTSEVPLTLC